MTHRDPSTAPDPAPGDGYVNYFEILDVADDAKPGEVRKNYKHKMKELVIEIGQSVLSESLRDAYLLNMARLNAGYFILRDTALREQYSADRRAVIALEAEWRAAAASGADTVDTLRRQFDGKLRHFLSTYLEERMLEAGRDPECVETSHWDAAHERHATRVLRHYRQRLYHEIHERLPFYDVTPPAIDWAERQATIARLIRAGV